MDLIYRPSPDEEQRYSFDMRRMPSIDAEAIEKVTGWTIQEWMEKIQKNSVTATRALLWVLQRRVHPGLKYAQVSFDLDQIDVELDADELIAARDATLDDDDMDEEQRTVQLDVIYARMDKLGVDRDAPAPKGARAKKSA